MATVKEMYEDDPFTQWAVSSGYYVSHFVGVAPVYMNGKDDPCTVDVGQRCYLIEEMYKIYKETHNE